MTKLLDPPSGIFASDGTPADPRPPIPCRVLLLEDNGMDADLVREHLLMIDDHDFDIQRVDTRQSFIDAVANGGPYDLILSDFDLPDFDGMSALAIARERLPRVPFIFVSGMLGEENAIEALKKGATDYVVKLRMERLQVVVRRALVEARDRNELADKRQALAESEARLRFALEAGRLGSWELTLADNRLRVSSICAANLGLSDPDKLTSYDQLLEHVHPEDREYQHAMVRQAVTSGSPLDMEYRSVWPDGSVHWVQVRGRAVYDRDGTPTGLAGVSLNITDRKKAEERQLLLLEELNHRVKNTLAMVQSIAKQTLRAAPSVEAFPDAFQSRLRALAQAHDLLTRRQWQGASLSEIAALTLEPHVHAGRVKVGGPPVNLTTGVAVSLHLAFHELATNAAKYGALSAENGRVELDWEIAKPAQPPVRAGKGGQAGALVLRWRESGGPPVVAPTRRGFGSRLIERGLAHELEGDVALAFDPAGVRCRLVIPLSSRVSPQ
ncbi:HWE histidine kinase domain-containing protein [Azospirillum sp. BE72]|uniref:sensor histidine kinase n=1 Tax=Azospirillum sp. BE72 TaxID=2817776 RepID=UPI00285A684F|nr:HWE histidine kinase domain-containing protein [Azospirillum sp. BE72]MDR6772523.1 PAS domain S-box-containing protein [Azospirillum sp. BE72]